MMILVVVFFQESPIRPVEEYTENEKEQIVAIPQIVYIEKQDLFPEYYEEINKTITEEEIDMLASITYLEAGNQSMAGKRAVVEAVLNRVMSDEFPDTIEEVLYQKGQFTPAAMISSTVGGEEEYLAVRQTLYCQFPILEGERLFFSTSPQKKDYIRIGDHYFC